MANSDDGGGVTLGMAKSGPSNDWRQPGHAKPLACGVVHPISSQEART